MRKHRVIVVGAGMGGLSAAAWLSKAGLQPLVLERTAFLGGRCSARPILGSWFDIGAVLLGSRVPEILRREFGIPCSTRPFRISARVQGQLISLPFGGQAWRELRSAGVTWLELASLLTKIPRLYWPRTFRRQPSLGCLLDQLTSNDLLRRLGYVAFGFSGVSPYGLPSHYLGMGPAVSGTVVGYPIALDGGNKEVAILLADYVRCHGGEIFLDEPVVRIRLNEACGYQITTSKGDYVSDYLVSNAGVLPTVFELTDSMLWSKEFLHSLGRFSPTLQVVNIFIKFASGRLFPDGFAAFLLAHDPIAEFELLENGRFPEQSMFILQVPSLIVRGKDGPQYATLQFYYPRGAVAGDILQRQVNTVLKEGLDGLFLGLSRQVEEAVVYDPDRYGREFGFRPVVYGIAPKMSCGRLSVRSPLPRLFWVGDAVTPDRPSVPQAMESGMLAARAIVGELLEKSGPQV